MISIFWLYALGVGLFLGVVYEKRHPKRSKTMGRIEKFTGNDGEYYWRYRSTNGNIMADGSQGYKNRVDRDNSLESVVQAFNDPDLETVTISEEN